MKKYYNQKGKEIDIVEYLYGEDVTPTPIPNEITVRRKELLQDHLAELLDTHPLQRQGARCNAVIAAIEWWQRIDN